MVFAGDTHNGWANNLTDNQGDAVGVELAVASVTSPGLEDLLSLPPATWPATEAAFKLLIDNLQYSNLGDRGYLVATFTEEKIEAQWHYVDNILSRRYQSREDRKQVMTAIAGENRLL